MELEDNLNIWQMEDDLNFFENGRQPQLKGEWKVTSSIRSTEDYLNVFLNGKQPQFLTR